jgi:molybdopterin/thiamine biosynthesis adenylyltransferase
MKEPIMSRPALKASIPYFEQAGKVHFRLSGELITLDDDDGRVRALLRLLDGSRDVDQISRELRAGFSDVTGEDVNVALGELDRLGLVQDVGHGAADFGPDDRERWGNNLGFFETYAGLQTSKYEFQRRIRETKVAMLGVGGVGSHVALDLVAIGFTDVRLVDFDKVALSNLNRQVLYGDRYIGQPKVEIAAERARTLNPGARVDAVQKWLGSADDVFDVISDRDVVIAALDRPKTQILHWLNEACVRAGAVLVTGGVDTQRVFHYMIVPGVTGCFECWYREAREQDVTTRDVADALRRTDEAGEAFGEDTAAFNGLVALHSAFLIGEVCRLATRICAPLSAGRVLAASFTDPVVREQERLPRPRVDCAVCAGVLPSATLSWLAETGPAPLGGMMAPAGEHTSGRVEPLEV